MVVRTGPRSSSIPTVTWSPSVHLVTGWQLDGGVSQHQLTPVVTSLPASSKGQRGSWQRRLQVVGVSLPDHLGILPQPLCTCTRPATHGPLCTFAEAPLPWHTLPDSHSASLARPPPGSPCHLCTLGHPSAPPSPTLAAPFMYPHIPPTHTPKPCHAPSPTHRLQLPVAAALALW